MPKSLTNNICDGVTAPDPWTPRPLSSAALPAPRRNFADFSDFWIISLGYPSGGEVAERPRLKRENSG